MRMAAPDRVEPSFVHDMLEATRFQGDESYFAHARRARRRRRCSGSPRTASTFHQPTYYLAKGPPRIQPVGGGATIHRELTRAAQRGGVSFRYALRGARRWSREDGAIAGVRLAGGETLPADAVILACGGFQANADDDARAFRRRRRGDAAARAARALQHRRRHPHGAGARRRFVRRAGTACTSSRSIRAASNRRRSCCSIPTASWSTATAAASSTRAAGLVHETWETVLARASISPCRAAQAYAILDRRVRDDRRLAARHALRGAAVRGRHARRAGRADRRRRRQISRATVAAYNAACTGDPATIRRHALRRACRRRATLQPPKSNWARAIAEPPFLAWPLIGAVAYTFGGLATDDRAARAARTARRSPASTPPARSPAISTAPRRTRCRCCARSCSDGSRGGRRLFLSRRDRRRAIAMARSRRCPTQPCYGAAMDYRTSPNASLRDIDPARPPRLDARARCARCSRCRSRS